MVKLLKSCTGTKTYPALFNDQLERIQKFYNEHIRAIRLKPENTATDLHKQQREESRQKRALTRQLQAKIVPFTAYEDLSNKSMNEEELLGQWSFLEGMERNGLMQMQKVIEKESLRYVKHSSASFPEPKTSIKLGPAKRLTGDFGMLSKKV